MAASQGQSTAHNDLDIRQFMAEKNIAVIEQHFHSLDLAPYDIFSPNLKGIISGARFEGV